MSEEAKYNIKIQLLKIAINMFERQIEKGLVPTDLKTIYTNLQALIFD